jgi:hypothetical protein
MKPLSSNSLFILFPNNKKGAKLHLEFVTFFLFSFLFSLFSFLFSLFSFLFSLFFYYFYFYIYVYYELCERRVEGKREEVQLFSAVVEFYVCTTV